MTTRTLDCGHPPSPHSEHTTGTAHTPDGREICWGCADANIRQNIATTAPGQPLRDALYLSQDGTRLTTWPGTAMLTITSLTERCVGYGGVRYYVRAQSPDGHHYHGTSPGPNMYARMRRSREA